MNEPFTLFLDGAAGVPGNLEEDVEDLCLFKEDLPKNDVLDEENEGEYTTRYD